MPSSQHTFASPADALRSLFSAWPADRGDGTGLTEAYIIAIQGYSLKAIDGAVKRLIRGEVDDVDRRFLPSPAQLGNLVAQLEKLYAPVERKLALPPPDDRPADDDAAAWQRRRAQAAAVLARNAPEQSPMLKPMTEAELDTFAAQERQRLREGAASGRFTLSAAARASFDKSHLDKASRPDPSEDFDAWESARAPIPNSKDMAA